MHLEEACFHHNFYSETFPRENTLLCDRSFGLCFSCLFHLLVVLMSGNMFNI